MSSYADAKQSQSEEVVSYRGEQPHGKLDDLVVPQVLHLDDTDERIWIPQAEDVSFGPLLLSVSQGYFANLLHVRKTGILSRHRHAGPVHAMTLKGR